ncbi:unnamed protein product, partial [Ectocarpus sp. 13 AM-2016]
FPPNACPLGPASFFSQTGSCPAESSSLTPLFGRGADPAAAAVAAASVEASPAFPPLELQSRWRQLPRIAPVVPPSPLPPSPPPLLLLLLPLLANGIPETAGSRRSIQTGHGGSSVL